MTDSTEIPDIGDDLTVIRTISTTTAVLVGVMVSYFYHAFTGGAESLFAGLNLELPWVTKVMMSGSSSLVVPLLTVSALFLAFVVKPDKAIKGQTVLVLLMFGFSLMSAQAFVGPMRMLVDAIS